jgi:hypothetical protein
MHRAAKFPPKSKRSFKPNVFLQLIERFVDLLEVFPHGSQMVFVKVMRHRSLFVLENLQKTLIFFEISFRAADQERSQVGKQSVDWILDQTQNRTPLRKYSVIIP